MRGKIDAGPGNYFITADTRGIRIPILTGTHLHIEAGNRFMLFKRDKRTLILIRRPDGEAIARVYKNCIMLNGKLQIVKRGIALGRYLHKETQNQFLIFKFDKTWI